MPHTAPHYHQTASEPDFDESAGFHTKEGHVAGSEVANSADDNRSAASTLPAKRLPLANARARSILSGILAITLTLGLSILASQINRLKPRIGLSGMVASDISCDLATEKPHTVESAFTIDLRGGHRMSFGNAKAIDVVWQLFVGQGGRLLMSLISYIAFMDGLTRLLEHAPVSFQFHSTLTFSTTSIFAVWQAMKEVFQLKGWRGKAFLIWFAISTTYVLAFQVLISATGGYVKPSVIGFRMPDGAVVTADSGALTSCFDIPAGGLIGLNNGSVISGPRLSDYDIRVNDRGDSISPLDDRHVASFQKDYPEFADLLNTSIHLANPVPNRYGDPQVPCRKRLSSHCEDTRHLYTTFNFRGHQYNFTDETFAYGSSFKAALCYASKALPDPNLANLSQCMPTSDYVFGFSSLMAKIVLSLQAIWTLGTFIVWLDANRFSKLCRHGRTVRGPFRAAQDFSEAITEALGPRTCAYPDDQLDDALRHRPGVRYYAEDGGDDSESSHIGLTTSSDRPFELSESRLYGCAVLDGRARLS